jgi:hypothetical protein
MAYVQIRMQWQKTKETANDFDRGIAACRGQRWGIATGEDLGVRNGN